MSNSNIDYLDAFNARHRTPTEVAKDFIAPSHFFQLLGLNHCVLIGPRGSGKTTLLKMLQAEALKSWAGQGDGKEVKVDFIGVFVPADIRWARQLHSLTKGIIDLNLQLKIYELAFGTAILLALVETLSKLKDNECFNEWKVLVDREKEVALVQQLSELWSVPVAIPSIGNLKHGLRVRQTRLPQIAAKLKENPQIIELSEEFPYIISDWLENLTTGISTINEAFDRPGQRWALLLDELEIVPAVLLQQIIGCLRSTSAQLIFKIALSPTGSSIFSQMDTKAPTAGNDFKLLRLWYDERNDLRLFAARLLGKALTGRIPHADDAARIIADLLGSSSIADEEDKSPHENIHSDRNKAFSELINIDSSFREFITQKKIDLSNLHSGEQGPLIRKIFPLVFFRSRILRKWDEISPQQRGGRIGLEPYTGYPNILDLTEGNPRWILNLADELISESKRKNQNYSNLAVQTSAVDAFHSRYASMLKVYPVESGRKQTIYAFLNALARSIKNRIYFNAFSSDPAMSFTVDDQAITQYGELLEACVHLGALIIMNPDSSKKVVVSNDKAGLVGSRLRLCYRLAPEFFLPLRSTSSIRLVSAISKDDFLNTQQNLIKKEDVFTKAHKNQNAETRQVPVQIKLF